MSTDEAKIWIIVVRGHLNAGRARWFEGLQIRPQPDGTTQITGPVIDQSALFGLLNHIRDLGLTLVSVQMQD
jgi:hypothetical protein